MPNGTKSAPKFPSLFPKDFWNHPEKFADVGDPDIDQIHLEVGRALSAWERADNTIAHIFLILSECETANSYNAVRRAFGSIESSSGRRRALEASAEIYFGHFWAEKYKVKRRISELMTAFEAGSRRRDEIAHGCATFIVSNDKPLGAFLFPPRYNTQRTHAFPKSETGLHPVRLTRA
jgi:hypothetical protein